MTLSIIAVVAVTGAALGIGTYGVRLARTTSDLFVASRAISPWWNAAAISGEYLSAASFLGVAGLMLKFGASALWLPVGFAALAGIPPLVGFWSKDAVLGVAWDSATHDGEWQGWLVLGTGLVVAALTAAYSMRAWLLVFYGTRSSERAPASGAARANGIHESPPLMTGPLVALAAMTVLGGAFVLWPGFLGVESDDVHVVVAVLSLAVVALAALFTWAEWLK